jgi:micrococcal nuclease
MFTYNCRIARIVDGDTLDVDIDLGFGIWKNNERIRLWQIDTPECRTRDKEEKKYGLIAKHYVEAHLPVGKTFKLQTLEKDKFGRYLGAIFVKNRSSINDMLLKANLAVKYVGQNKKEVMQEHLNNRKILAQKA